MPHKRIKMEGLRFGKLLVLEVAGKKGTNFAYKCQCDCGNVKVMNGYEIRSRVSVSCGCWARESLLAGRNIKPPGEASKRYLFNLYKARAKKKDFPFSLTFEYFSALTKGNCTFCGSEPKFRVKNSNANGEYIYNGIDRLDSGQGYTISNSVTCCGRCNQAKNDMSVEQFFTLVEAIYNTHLNKKAPGTSGSEG